MAASYTTLQIPTPTAERVFRLSLFFLLLISVSIVATTGKLDGFSSLCALLLVMGKGFRLWMGKPAELTARPATFLVIAYLFSARSMTLAAIDAGFAVGQFVLFGIVFALIG